MKAKSPVLTIRDVGFYERFIYTLRPDCLESATPSQLGGSTVDRVFFYDEITEVYRYRNNDWAALRRMFGAVMLCGGIGAAVWTGGSVAGAVALWLLGVIWIGIEIYFGFVVKKPMVRVIGNKQSATFCCRNESFFVELLTRLRAANPAPVPPVTTPTIVSAPSATVPPAPAPVLETAPASTPTLPQAEDPVAESTPRDASEPPAAAG